MPKYREFDADTSFNNKDSQVLVGLAITGGLDKINNDNNTDLHRVDAVAPGGYSRSHTVGWNSKGTEHRNKWGKPVIYQPAPVATFLPVKLGEVKEYTQSQGNIDPTEQLNTQTVQRNIDAANTVVMGPLTSQQPDSQDVSIRTVAQDHLTLPSNALYITAKDSQAQYIVETDPAFANYKKWLSSDYMLDALGLDPAMQQKRIGDGFYEQRLVQDQVAQLTGFRFLEGYGSDEEQYKALMNNGLSFAKQYGLRVGVALSEAQIAQLTSDIVWLEEKTVKLADESTAKTLVPQVYVKARVGDLKGDGTLISANSIDLKVQGNVFNSGTIAGRQAVVLSADNVELMNGRIQANQVGITTQKDLNIVGGQIQAEKTADLNVGANFNLSSSIQNSQNIVGESAFTYIGIDRVAGIYTKTPLNQVSTNTENLTQTITIRVGGDAKLVGSEIQNANGQTSIQSQGDLMIGAIQTGINNKGYANEKNYNYSTTQADQGTSIHGQGTVELKANQIAGKAVDLASKQGDIVLNAQHGIKLENGEDLKATDVAMSAKSGGILARSTERNDISKSSQSIANQLNSGGNIVFNTEQGNITATHLKADAGETIQIQAKNGDVTLNSALNETSQSSTSSNTNFVTYKNRQTGYIDQEVAQNQLTAGKNIDINAGKNIELQANDVKAGQSIYVGNTLMQRQADGTLKAADGSLMPENVTLSTLETHDQQWDEQQKGYRGIVKDLVKVTAIGLAGIEALAPGLKVGKITVGESKSSRGEQTKHTGTSLNADNVYAGSAGQTTLTSTDIAAKNTIISGQQVNLNAAEEQNISEQSQSKETIEGLGVKLNKDNIRLGGFVSEDITQSTKTIETTHKAGSIITDNLKVQAADGIDILGQNIKATGDTVLDHGRGDLNIGGYENKTTVEDKTHTETISTEVGVRNAYLDAALAVGAVKDAAEAVKQAKDQYSQAQRDHAAGKITKEALDDSKANIAMATANLANAQIAVGAAAASAAASSATYGFTIGANGERIETTTTTNTLQGEWQGSNLDLNNLTLKSENQDVNIQGSRVSATGTTTFDGTKDLNVTAGTEHAAQDSSSKTNSQSVSYTYGGGGSASVGKQTSKSQSESLTHVNSQVELNQTAGSINKLNIQGGEVSIADRGSLKVNEIHVESLQDTATSSNSSKGGSIGAGFGSSGLSNVTAGYNQNKGNSDSAWVNDTSKLLIGNAQNNADLDAMGVKNITNIGGVIANATKNPDGSLTDHGKLNYSGELELKDIEDHNYNSSSGFNVSTTIGKTTEEKDGQKSKYPNGSTTIGLNSSGQETKQLTKATLGQGTVTNVTDTTNRDINNTQEITRDQTTGMLDGSVTVDHRLLTESGRAEIIQQQKDLPENFRQSAENIVKQMPEGEYKEKALKSLNNIQAKLYSLPADFEGLEEYGQQVAGELLKNGLEIKEVEKIIDTDNYWYAIQKLSAVQEQLDILSQNGSGIEQILNSELSKEQPVVNSNSLISILAENTDSSLAVKETDLLGFKFLHAAAEISKNIEKISVDSGVDIEKIQLAASVLLGGPVKATAGYIVNQFSGEYIDYATNAVSDHLVKSLYGLSDGLYDDWSRSEKISELKQLGLSDDDFQRSLNYAESLQNAKLGATFIVGIAAETLISGKGKAKNSDEISVKPTVPDYVTRNDHDFSATENYKGKPKAYINDKGDLVAANPEGTGSVQSHIRGGNSENTPYISTSDPAIAIDSKNYGGEQIKIDTKRLQEDIDAGKISGSQIVTHTEVRKELQSKVDAAQAKYDRNPSKKNRDKLRDANKDLNHAIRDGECLIKGCVPSEYIKK